MIDRGPLPSGVVTFLFTDIQGSTERWQSDRAAMAEALAAHDRMLIEVMDGAEGQVFKHTGDGVCAVFASPQRAAEAALKAQDVVGLPVRMGLHTGEAEQRDGDYFGPTLNRCARVMDAGHGGQTLATAATVALLEGFETVDLGEHRLKGFVAGERIFQIGNGKFPALRVSGSDSLPRSRTSFIGRDELVDAVAARMDDARLVTLVGPAGVGKTRLAVGAARLLSPVFDGTSFVDLGLASDPADVVPTLCRALGVTAPTVDAAVMSLSSVPTLLVLDNCEHVIESVAELVEEILEQTDTTRVLATSREALAIEGEELVAVPGLDGRGPDSPAVRLFVDRAQAVAADFVLDADNEGVVQELCQRLDHLPLAIELAAARVSAMTPTELFNRLDDRFSVLTGGRRRRKRDRHQTLREAIDWSYDLLDPDEKQVLAHLAAFGGEFDIGAAGAVNADLSDAEVLDIVAALVDKSLLTVVRGGDRSRYRLLETIRSYAEDRLMASGKTDEVMGWLHAHMTALLDDVLAERWTSGSGDSRRRLRQEIPNLRRALDFALERQDTTAAAELVAPRAEVIAAAVQGFHGWADEILELPEAADHPSRQALLAIRAAECHYEGKWRLVGPAADEVLAARSGEETPWWALWTAAFVKLVGGQHDVAHQLASDASDAAVRYGPDEALISRLLAYMAGLADTGTVAEGDQLEDDLVVGRAHPSALVATYACWCEAVYARTQNDYERMLSAAQHILETVTDDDQLVLPGLLYRGWALLGLGRTDEAVEAGDALIDFGYRWGTPSEFLGALTIYAVALQMTGDAPSAAEVRGRLPRRFTFTFTDEIQALDRWLDQMLPPTQLASLTQQGKSHTPKALQHLTHKALEDGALQAETLTAVQSDSPPDNTLPR